MLYQSFKDIDRSLVQVGGAVPLLILSWRGSCPPPLPPGSCVLVLESLEVLRATRALSERPEGPMNVQRAPVQVRGPPG